MKIMTAMYTLKKGGSYDRFVVMLEAFLEKGCRVHCLSLTPILIRHPLYSNHVIPFPFAAQTGFAARATVLLLFPFYLVVLGWHEKIDLFVAFGPLYAFLQALAKWILGKPMVTLIRLDLSSASDTKNSCERPRMIKRMIEHLGIQSSDRIIVNNSTTEQEVIRILRKRERRDVLLLPNNVPSIPASPEGAVHETRTRLGIPKEGKLVVTAGVLTPRKNVDVLLRSFPNVGIPGLCLVIAGDASSKADTHYADGLKQLTRSLDLEKKVFFTGWLEKADLWRILRAADLFILPSLKEGMPNVLLEALGCGVPCLGSNIPGIRDILSHETLMFDPHDDESLTEKIRRFLSDEDARRRISHLCSAQSEMFRFDWKEKVFEAVTERQKSAEPQN
jgi:glycosyltransferase involved in cell wall biosynthesis